MAEHTLIVPVVAVKRCACCRAFKPPADFPKKAACKDGLSCYCRPCTVEKFRDYERRNPESVRKNRQKWAAANRERTRRNGAKWREKNYEKLHYPLRPKNSYTYHTPKKLERCRLWKLENKDKTNVHIIVRKAVRNGVLIRPSACELCGIECKPDAHHDDYSQPLKVVFLCRQCHALKNMGRMPIVAK